MSATKKTSAGPGGFSLPSLGNIGSIIGQIGAITGSGKATGVADLISLAGGLTGGKSGGKSTQNLPAIIGGAGPILGRLLPNIGKGLIPSIGGGAIGGLVGDLIGGGGAMSGGCPAGYHQAKDGSGRCVRNRRMNSLNPRAFRRALRRMKGAKKFAAEIARAFPKARRAPAGHRKHLHHA